MLDTLCLEIKSHYRTRQDLLNAELRLTNQLKAICRRAVGVVIEHAADGKKGKADKKNLADAQALYKSLSSAKITHRLKETVLFGTGAPFLLDARAQLVPAKKHAEKQLATLAEQLPVFPWWNAFNGCGALGLALIVAEAGDLCRYPGPAKLWKRMGLALVNGERQRKSTDPEKAIAFGYNPRRRSLMFVLGDSLIKKQNPFRDCYLERKATEAAKTPDAPKIVLHRRAQRYMEKRLLRELWRTWNDAPPAPDYRQAA